MVSLRAEREQATALLRRDRWRLGIVIGVVLLAIAGLLVLAGGKPVPPGRSEYDAGTTGPVAVPKTQNGTDRSVPSAGGG